MNTVKRFPRPYGITAMMVEYHKTQDDELLSRVKNSLINLWLINNGYLSGNPYTINQLAQVLKVDISAIRIVMRDQLLNSQIWKAENQKSIIEGMLGEQLAWVLEDRMAVSQQLELLRASQGDTYKPFISAEVNKAMKLKLDTTSNLAQVIKSLVGGSNVNISIDQSENTTNVQNNITLEDARKLILETNRELEIDKSKELRLLETQYDLESLPEVVATKQSGIDTSKEGLNFNTNELMQITDNYKGAMAESEKVSHEMRREIEQKIDTDAEDPELDIYDDYEEEPEDSFSAENFLL